MFRYCCNNFLWYKYTPLTCTDFCHVLKPLLASAFTHGPVGGKFFQLFQKNIFQGNHLGENKFSGQAVISEEYIPGEPNLRGFKLNIRCSYHKTEGIVRHKGDKNSTIRNQAPFFSRIWYHTMAFLTPRFSQLPIALLYRQAHFWLASAAARADSFPYCLWANRLQLPRSN